MTEEAAMEGNLFSFSYIRSTHIVCCGVNMLEFLQNRTSERPNTQRFSSLFLIYNPSLLTRLPRNGPPFGGRRGRKIRLFVPHVQPPYTRCGAPVVPRRACLAQFVRYGAPPTRR